MRKPLSMKCRLQTGYKINTAECRLGIKCKLSIKLYAYQKNNLNLNIISAIIVGGHPTTLLVGVGRSSCWFSLISAKFSLELKNTENRIGYILSHKLLLHLLDWGLAKHCQQKIELLHEYYMRDLQPNRLMFFRSWILIELTRNQELKQSLT